MMRGGTLRRAVLAAGVGVALTFSTLAATSASAAPPSAALRPVAALKASTPDGRTADVAPISAIAAVEGNFVARHSGRCLDAIGGTGATGNGVGIQQYDCLGSAQTNQIWNFYNEIYANGYYYYNIVAVHSGKCLDVTGGTGATGNGVQLQQYDCLGGPQTNQQWRLVLYPNGFAFIARHSQKCLDVTGGTGATGNGVRPQQYTCLGNAQTNQLWSI